MVKVAWCERGFEGGSFSRRAILFMKRMKLIATLPATLHKILRSRDWIVFSFVGGGLWFPKLHLVNVLGEESNFFDSFWLVCFLHWHLTRELQGQLKEEVSSDQKLTPGYVVGISYAAMWGDLRFGHPNFGRWNWRGQWDITYFTQAVLGRWNMIIIWPGLK